MLHLFNPDNDLALAANLEHYTPPKAAMQLKRDGAVLPMWYGSPGDRVICYGVEAQWYDRMHALFPGLPELHDHRHSLHPPEPWGWSKAAREALRREGADPSLLPSDADLERLRELSHRRTAARLASRLREMLPDVELPDAAVEARSCREVEELMKRWGGVYVKQPWSGSGRGVICSLPNPAGALRLAETSIRTQGSVLVEPALAPGLDFARIYRCHDGLVEDLGTSVFTTDALGHYTGNLLAPEEVRFDKVAQRYPAEVLMRVFQAVRVIIREEIAPYYSGIVGVDMLVSAEGKLHPAVEVNLRHTMGYVANRFAELHLHPQAIGRFEILPPGVAPAISDFETADGRLLSGTLVLTPPGTAFTIRCTVSQ